jgi:hypothetical protein
MFTITPLYLTLVAGALGSSPILNNTITRDVVVLGGGSSGTYAAIALRDANLSVAVIEREHRLGGHTNTYIDPISRKPTDYGVVALGNIPIVWDYIKRLGLTPLNGTVDPGTIEFLDFETGKRNPYYVQKDPTDAIKRYAEQLANYPYLDATYDLPDEIPEELLEPWGKFMEKYDLGGMSREVFQWAQGYGDILDLPALYFVKFLSPRWIGGLAGGGFVFPSTMNFSSIYAQATQELSKDVLFGSTVFSANRDTVDSEGYFR